MRRIVILMEILTDHSLAMVKCMLLMEYGIGPDLL